MCGRYVSERIPPPYPFDRLGLIDNRSISRRANKFARKKLPTSTAINRIKRRYISDIDETGSSSGQSPQIFFFLSSPMVARTFGCGFSDVFNALFGHGRHDRFEFTRCTVAVVSFAHARSASITNNQYHYHRPCENAHGLAASSAPDILTVFEKFVQTRSFL